jgi:hypothetical protein
MRHPSFFYKYITPGLQNWSDYAGTLHVLFKTSKEISSGMTRL